jgi:hypothetical protein
MKIKFLTASLLLFNICFSQSYKIIVKAEKNNELQKGVLFYSKDKIIGKTDEKGEIILDLKLLDTILIVKEEFDDISIDKVKLLPIIYLKKVEVILLNEVVLLNYNNAQILDKIEYTLTSNKKIYKYPQSMQYFNLLTIDKDTLHFLNNRLQLKNNEGFYINSQNKIIKKFFIYNDLLVYQLNNNRIQLWAALNSRLTSISQKDGLLKVLKNKDQYTFVFNKTEDYYKINYISKKKKELSYEGYLIVDKLDFGIYELEMKLIQHSANIYQTYSFEDKKNLTYQINEENLFYSFTKINNEYHMNNTRYDLTFIQTKGDFKSSKFVNKYRVENTPSYSDKNAYKFDFVNYTKL